jgi:hypothetical protein
MKLPRAFQLLAGVAMLGSIAAYIEMTRTTAQSSERAAATGESAPVRTAARTPDPAVESPPSGGNARTAARTPAEAAVESPPPAGNARTAARTPPEAAVESPPSGGNARTAARTPPEAAIESPPPAGNARTEALTPPETAVESPPSPGNVRTAARTPDTAVERSPSAGNPLWALALKQLSTTRDRPIFSPSRRPPPPATPTYVAPVAVRQPAKPAEPERPAITLLGTIIGTDDRIGVFVETSTQNFVRLRVGDDHEGWVLRLIKAREVTLVKDRDQVAVLELPPPGESAMQGNQFMPGGVPAGMPPRGIPGMPPGGIVGLPGGAVPGAAGFPPGAGGVPPPQLRRQSGR